MTGRGWLIDNWWDYLENVQCPWWRCLAQLYDVYRGKLGQIQSCNYRSVICSEIKHLAKLLFSKMQYKSW